MSLDYREVEGGSYGAKGVPQSLTVAVLNEWVHELGAEVRAAGRSWDSTPATTGSRWR